MEWRHQIPLAEKGVIVGCDRRQEWILTWWWKHYTKHNTFPVTFVDWGLSEEAKEWCHQRGNLSFLEMKDFQWKEREALDPALVAIWEKGYGTGFWASRKSWFYKPFALLHTPYEKTLWLDVDCQVKDNLSVLFDKRAVALCPLPDYDKEYSLTYYRREFEMEHRLILPNEVIFNTGVLLYAHKNPLILQWAREVLPRAQHFLGDQNLLSRIIFENHYTIEPLPQIYNWYLGCGHNPEAKIIHFIGDLAKEFIWHEVY